MEVLMKKYFVGIFIFLLGCGNGSDVLTHSGICDGYTISSSSPYRLPWAAGTARAIAQGNCASVSHFGSQRYAYDIDMPVGTSVLAARGGTVIEVTENNQDGNGCPLDNNVYIQHSDGTVAGYIHLTLNGALVNVGDIVSQGQAIALSGNTGCSSGAHLHFVVFKNRDKEDSVPVTFLNTTLHRRGLRAGENYLAN